MQAILSQIQDDAKAAVDTAKTLAQLANLKAEYLGKQGKITDLLKEIPKLPKADRPQMGQEINKVKVQINDLFQGQEQRLQAESIRAALHPKGVDYTLPEKQIHLGSRHPISQTKEEMVGIFSRLGFSMREGSDIESDYYNFEALNIPQDHPARDMHDTFYFSPKRLLRTHTSAVQIHSMESETPPLRIIVPGMVYRCDADVTHSPVFHQIEGLLVDTEVSFAQLKGLIEFFLQELFGTDKKVRFRPSYFPFTEPSCEVDVEWGTDPKTGETRWMEIMGAGMVHPNVLRSVKLDPEQYSGLAFGIGIDRVAMLKYGIDDIRLLYENDARFLAQF